MLCYCAYSTHCRTAVTSFITFAANSGSSSKPVTLECPPQTADEARMAAQPVGLPKTEGWFRVCFLGASDPGGVVGKVSQPSAPSTPAAARPGTLALTAAATPAGTSAGATPAAVPAVAGTSSTEYSARLAESMYMCVLHALVFLRSTAPQVGEGEGPVLGPTWPKARELHALQEQCMAVLYSVADGPRGPQDQRRTRILNNLLRVLQLLCEFLGEVGCPPAMRASNARLRAQLAMVEEHLKSGERLPPAPSAFVGHAGSMSPAPSMDAGAFGFGSGLSPGLSGSLSMSVSQVGA